MTTTQTPPARHAADHSGRWAVLTLLIDAVLVVLFAALGRRSHESSLDLIGVLGTAAPFLISLAVAALITRHARTWSQLWPAGVFVWAITVVGGLLLRVWVFGDTAALAFQFVAAGTLMLLLLGRRLVTWLLMRRASAAQS